MRGESNAPHASWECEGIRLARPRQSKTPALYIGRWKNAEPRFPNKKRDGFTVPFRSYPYLYFSSP